MWQSVFQNITDHCPSPIPAKSPPPHRPTHPSRANFHASVPLIRDVANCSSVIVASACRISNKVLGLFGSIKQLASSRMHPPLTIHRHPMCAEIIEQFQKCHIDHPLGKFFGECTGLKIKLDKCFRQEKALRRKANFEESKKLKKRLREYRKENLETSESKAFAQASCST